MEWPAMEINPEMLNKMMSKLGVGGEWSFVDVLGMGEEDVSAVPKPCCALILLFPLTQQHESFRASQTDKVVKDSGAYFLKQTIVNSCGTIALLHAVGNNRSQFDFKDGSALKKFLDDTAGKSPDDRAKLLETNQDIQNVHTEVASEAQGRPEEDHNFHIIAFTNVNGMLHEFDGKLDGPLTHTATTEGSFVKDAAAVCRGFIEREKGEVRFSGVALCRA
ncbi:ubiquitin carboxyl-terminal hydrolase isozyme L1 isoform X1 [Synchiropus splendidus]|uniref:ubiquitin carboxyl-terminal hydrolase isozyme L1 isoform X1 n=2 Tax=Synchiropus splendidus TaxID=270530 RepID=UPI00237E9E0A|nr:ubiquitin carboxyl-terminal hydrolase isozyme L1 isoform X1 [Synchiropus splendidus]